MNVVGRAMLALSLTGACTRTPVPDPVVPPDPVTPPAQPPVPADASIGPPPAPCKLPLEDAQSRQRGGEVARTVDLDGDGRADTMVRSCHGGNCDFLLYLEQTPCARYVGMIQGSIMDEPSCVAPPQGQPCTISVMRFMIHGDLQEYLFAIDPGTGEYAELGYGEHYVPPPPAKLR